MSVTRLQSLEDKSQQNNVYFPVKTLSRRWPNVISCYAGIDNEHMAVGERNKNTHHIWIWDLKNNTYIQAFTVPTTRIICLYTLPDAPNILFSQSRHEHNKIRSHSWDLSNILVNRPLKTRDSTKVVQKKPDWIEKRYFLFGSEHVAIVRPNSITLHNEQTGMDIMQAIKESIESVHGLNQRYLALGRDFAECYTIHVVGMTFNETYLNGNLPEHSEEDEKMTRKRERLIAENPTISTFSYESKAIIFNYLRNGFFKPPQLEISLENPKIYSSPGSRSGK